MVGAADQADVLIVGGGVLGCATAYYLARRGLDVLLVERGAPNREASGANAGTLHIHIPAFHFRNQYLDQPWSEAQARYFAATNRLYLEAARLWAGIEQELRADLGVRIVGGLMVAETEDELRVLCAKAAYEQSVGLDVDVLTGDELRARAPRLSPHLVGAAYCMGEGFANPLLAGPAFLRAARRHGARLRTHTDVRDVEPESARRGFEVMTNSGSIRARRVVVAAGAQTRQVTQRVGLDLPILQHPLQVMVTQTWPALLPHLVQHAGDRHLSLRQTQYGTFVIGGGWPAEEPGADGRLPVRARSVAASAAVDCDVLPALREVPLVRAWAGMTTATGRRNRIGYLGVYERLGRGRFFVVVAGGWGFTLAPALGQLTAELVSAGHTSLDTQPFDLEQATALL